MLKVPSPASAYGRIHVNLFPVTGTGMLLVLAREVTLFDVLKQTVELFQSFCAPGNRNRFEVFLASQIEVPINDLRGENDHQLVILVALVFPLE